MSEIVKAGPKNVGEALVLNYQEKFEKALGYELISGHLSFGNFLVAVAEDVANSPKLAEAFQVSPGTAVSQLLMAAQCKLLPGSKYGYFYLIPRAMNRKTPSGWVKTPEVTALIGYKGLLEMSKRHPRVHKIEAQVVYEGEEFAFLPGESKIIHKWSPDVDRSDEKLIAAYARCVITEPNSTHAVHDEPIIHCMSRKEIEKSRSRSEAWKSAEESWNGKPPKKDSPWHTDYAAMCRKTVLRALLNGGSVPRDMGMGGVLNQEIEAEQRSGEVPQLPAASQSSAARQLLGIEKPQGPFEMVEFALQAITEAKSAIELQGLAERWQHFQGSEAEQIAWAYEQKTKEFDA